MVPAACAAVVFLLGCPGDRDNPLDPNSSLPDPFQIEVSLSDEGVQLEWQGVKVSGVKGYRIYRSSQEATAGTVVGHVSSTVTSYLDQTGFNTTTYWYRVAAVDANGAVSSPSLPDSVTIAGARLHATPLLWAPEADSASFQLHIGSDSTICRFNYSVSSTAGWLSVSKSGGTAPDSVLIRVGANSTGSEHSALIMVNAPNVADSPDTVVVTQSASDPGAALVINPYSVRLPGLGGTSEAIVISVTGGSFSSYTISVSDSWVTPSKISGSIPDTITVSARDNFGESPRDAWVRVYASGIPQPESLKVHQARMVWEPLGSGTNYLVRCLETCDGKLIAAGQFTTAGGIAVDHMASWDGQTWSPFGSGNGVGPATMLNVFELLYAGFVDGVAYWTGSYWDTVASGMNGWVEALARYQGTLYVGGGFDSVGDAAINYLAFWSSSGWSRVGSGLSGIYGRVIALTTYNGKLIAGGNFWTPYRCIAAWDGSTWSSLGSGTGGAYEDVYALAVYDGNLIAGGVFTSAGGVSANHVASWNGSSWSPLGSGVNNLVVALTVYDGRLIAAGFFDSAGGTAASGIASWDGVEWSPLGSGMNDRVYALEVYNNQLIAAGYFEQAGGVPANNIAVLKEED